MTRHNYRAAVAEIVWSLGVTKAMASMAVTGSFLTYGIGQIFNGFIGDRIKPKTMIFLGLCATTLCNVVMSKLSSVYIMTAVWCINGFAQSMLWPPLTRIMSENLSADRYRKTVTAVITASSLATISIYFIVPLCITLSGWRAVFLLSAAFGLTAGIIWLISIDRLTESNKEPGEKEKEKTATPVVSFKSLIFGSGLIYVIIILMAHGILRDGITTWMPSYINDVYQFGTSLSILNTAILPIFSVISLSFASRLFKSVQNELKASAILWSLGFISSFIFVFVYASQAFVSILMMALVTGCMHGVNLMLIGVFPARFKDTGRVSTVSGLLNAFTYLGSALSTYGIAAVSDHYGWKTTVLLWCIIACIGTLLSFVHFKKEKSTL